MPERRSPQELPSAHSSRWRATSPDTSGLHADLLRFDLQRGTIATPGDDLP